MTEIAAVHPRRQFYENGILREEPPYQPPRWRCDECGVERPVKDHGFYVIYKDEAERPGYPAGWIIMLEMPEKPQYMSKRVWHFCSLKCLVAYPGWEQQEDA